MPDDDQSTPLDDLAEKGRAARLAQDRKTAELRAKIEAGQSETHRKLAAKYLSPLALNPLRFVPTIAGVTLWGTSLMMAFPYFRYFLNGGHPVHGTDKSLNHWVLDPKKDGYLLFYIFLATTTLMVMGLVWRSMARRAGERAIAAETAWAEAAPFPVLGYPTAVGEDENRYKIEFYFAGHRMPPHERFADALRGIDEYVLEDSWNSNDRRCQFRAEYPRDDHPARNAQRFVPTLHAIVDLLAKMQNEHPVDRIEVRGV